jgi:hypothetical protein
LLLLRLLLFPLRRRQLHLLTLPRPQLLLFPLLLHQFPLLLHQFPLLLHMLPLLLLQLSLPLHLFPLLRHLFPLHRLPLPHRAALRSALPLILSLNVPRECIALRM